MDLSPLPFEASNYPRTYRVSHGYAVFLGLCGGLLALGGCTGSWYFATTPELRGARSTFLTLLCLAFAFLGAYLIVLITRMSVTLRSWRRHGRPTRRLKPGSVAFRISMPKNWQSPISRALCAGSGDLPSALTLL